MGMIGYLFGCWYRTGRMGAMAFLTRRAASKYGTRGFGAIDPYAPTLTGPTIFVPGRLLRRGDRHAALNKVAAAVDGAYVSRLQAVARQRVSTPGGRALLDEAERGRRRREASRG